MEVPSSQLVEYLKHSIRPHNARRRLFGPPNEAVHITAPDASPVCVTVNQSLRDQSL